MHRLQTLWTLIRLLNPLQEKFNYPLNEYHKYENLLYFIERDTNFEYETERRYQDLQGAKLVDENIKNFLTENKIEYKSVNGIGQDTIDLIINELEQKLK